jgi:hypothetical protein
MIKKSHEKTDNFSVMIYTHFYCAIRGITFKKKSKNTHHHAPKQSFIRQFFT